MPSPICEVQDGAGAFQSTTDGVNVTPGQTVTIRLASGAGVNSWTIPCITADDTTDADAITASLTINSSLKTASFTAPAAGKALRFESLVQGGIGPDGVERQDYRTTFCIYTLAANGERVIALDETFEGDSVYGWMSRVNRALRGDIASSGGGGGGGGGTTGKTTKAMANASQTLSSLEAEKETWELTSTPPITANRTLTIPAPATEAETYQRTIRNLTAGKFDITAATNASPIAITTSGSHGLATGNRVFITGVLGNTAANGYWIITSTGATTLTLTGSTGNGAYTSGGTLLGVGNGSKTITVTTGTGRSVELDPHQEAVIEVSSTGVDLVEPFVAGELNVLSFGAKRYGTLTEALSGTDSSAAFNAAFAAMRGTSAVLEALGGTLRVPKGYYRIRSDLSCKVSGRIVGGGGSQRFGSTNLVFDDGKSIVFDFDPSVSGRCDGLTVEHITFRGPASGAGYVRTLGGSIRAGVLVHAQTMAFYHCSFFSFDGAGCEVDGNLGDNYFANGLTFQHCDFDDNTTDGIYVHGGNANSCSFINCRAGYNGKDRNPAYVFQVDASGPTYTDITAAATSGAGGDVLPFPAVDAAGDYLLIGSPNIFTKLHIDNSSGVQGVNADPAGTAVEWEYWSQNYTDAGKIAISGATNASPIEITATAHGRVTGDTVYIAGVLGNTAANGHWIVTSTGADTLTLNGSVGNGAYTAGDDFLFTPVAPSWLPLKSKFLHSIQGDSGGLKLNDFTHVPATDRWIYWEEMTPAENGQALAWDPAPRGVWDSAPTGPLQYWIRARIKTTAYSTNPTLDQIWIADGAGFNDSSFLGNTYIGCLTEGNPTPWRLTGGTNRCAIINPYMELDQGPCKLVQNAVVVGSGMDGRTGISQHTRIATNNCSSLTAVNSLNSTATISSGLGYHDTSMVAFRWKRSETDYEYRLYYDATASNNKWVCQSTSGTKNAYYLTEEGHAQGAGIMVFLHGVQVGQNRYINFGTAAPSGASLRSSGQWKQGDILWNQNYSTTTPLAWVCTVDGNPGTHVAVYAAKRGTLVKALNDTAGGTTLAAADKSYRTIECTGALTALRTLFLGSAPSTNAEADEVNVFNNTTGGFAVRVDLTGTPGTYVDIAAGMSAIVRTGAGAVGVKRVTADVTP